MNDISILSTNVNSYTKQQHKQDRSLNFSDLIKQSVKEKISKPNQEPAKFTYTTSSQNSLISLNFNDLQAYGYTVDKAGFMGADFNKAASLPQDFKIHKSTLDELSRFAERNHVLNRIKSKDEQIKIFDNIDMADTIKHYYRLFDQMTSALGDDKKSYTLADIGKLPKGYSTKGTSYDAKGHLLKDLSNSTISNIYSSTDELNSAKSISKELSSAGVRLIVKEVDFTMSEAGDEFSFNPDMSVYQADEGYSKEALFMGFLRSSRPLPSDSAKTKLSSAALNDISSTGEHKEYFVDFEKVGKDSESIKALIKERLKELTLLMYARSKNTSTESVTSNEYEKFKPTSEDINSLANSWSGRISAISKTFV
ncbi:Cj0814 family flagellar-dependent secreted protein [Campylobacter concisus]|uniref:Cj0814 family flagellar-dependent secreted protein n=1 Tax=Campylobacter concisus TaxID=199 RepID=UPI0021560857|nr:flagellar biosynthesis protein FlgG [Campylobacter concisus]